MRAFVTQGMTDAKIPTGHIWDFPWLLGLSLVTFPGFQAPLVAIFVALRFPTYETNGVGPNEPSTRPPL